MKKIFSQSRALFAGSLFPRVRREVAIINASGTFSDDWYRRQRQSPCSDPVRDFVLYGARAGLNPHPLFDTDWYLCRYADVSASKVNPFVHYLAHGWKEGRDPGPLFQSKWYVEQHPQILSAGVSPLEYYEKKGKKAGHLTSPLFDPRDYQERLNLSSPKPQDLFTHFVERGFSDGLDPGPFFSGEWYREHYPDVVNWKRPPLWHYTALGAYEGCSPCSFFDADWYHGKYPDAAPTGTDALIEFLTFGQSAGRMPSNPALMLADARIAVIAHLFYEDVWPEIREALKRIPIPFDLFVTAPEDRVALFQSVVWHSYPHARFIVTKNRGRDIGPFFEALLHAERFSDYTAICKIHTKKGITQPQTWRRLLLESVLGSSFQIYTIIKMFLDHPDVGIIGSKDLYFSGPKFIGPNYEGVERIAKALYPGKKIPPNWGFFAGTMFWFRPQMFASLSRFVAGAISFEGDSSLNDGQIAHSLERVFGLLPNLSGHKIGLTEGAGDRHVGHLVTLCSPPGNPNREPPTNYLLRKSRELGYS